MIATTIGLVIVTIFTRVQLIQLRARVERLESERRK